MRHAVLLATAVGFVSGVGVTNADAWMRGYSGGGYTHGGDAGGWQHSTTVTSQGVSHSSDYGGYEHGTQANANGVAHESDAGGAWHGHWTGLDRSGVCKGTPGRCIARVLANP